MDLENEYRETKIMKTATNSAPTTPLNDTFPHGQNDKN